MANPLQQQLSTTAEFLTLPNIITFGRLCSVPLILISCLRQRMDWAFAIFICASISDALDGWLARRRGGNVLGAIMDPLADKILLVTMYISLAAIGSLPDWLAILVVFRDLTIVGGVLMMVILGNEIKIQPLSISKLNTFFQIFLIGTVLLRSGFELFFAPLTSILIWVVAMTTLVSGAAYIWSVVRGR